MDKTCIKCKTDFEITPDDLEFYKKVSVPNPTLCPICRQQRRLNWRGERTFYQRKCDLCQKDIISIFAPNNGYIVYCNDCWWGDGWEAKKSGRDFDFSRSFFEQFEELLKTTPLLSSWLPSCENSQYNNNASYLKNCYLLSSSNVNEDSYYGYFINDSKDCMDSRFIKKSELMYECLECINCFNLRFSQNCTNCQDSWFLHSCIGCKNCFGSINLRHKEFYYFNEPLSETEYKQKISAFFSGKRTEIEKMIELVREHHLKYPHKFMVGEQNEDVTGNNVFESKNSHACFNSVNIEDCKYCCQMQNAKNCYDMMTWGRPAEYLYECMGTGLNAYMNRFVAISQDSSYVTYGYDIMFSKNLFGCVSVKRGEFMVFNKQYSKEEYEQLVEKIIEHMKEHGEWGEFFPASMSPFSYNEALSNDFFPLTKEEVLSYKFKWKDPDKKEYQPQTYKLPNDINEIGQDIVNQLLACKDCGKNYKIIPQEFVYYKQKKLPVPELCPTCRHKKRIDKCNPTKLWHRKCDNDGYTNEFETTYAPDRPEKVYCESCYQRNII